jgi:hypothetical protein
MAATPQDIATAALEAKKEFQAIQTTIVQMAVRLRSQCRLYLVTPAEETKPLTEPGALQARFLGFLNKAQQRIGGGVVHAQNQAIVAAWNVAKGGFFEVLCLLATLDRLPPASRVKIPNVFGGFRPIPVADAQGPAYLWFQPNIIKTKSGLRARPDLAIARSAQQLDETTIVSVTECKWGKNLTAALVRTEFGKAFDLQVTSYTIVSYKGASDRLKDAARLLGIDVVDFGLGTPQREAYLRQERDLGEDLAERLAIVRTEARFASILQRTAEASGQKMLHT